MNYDQNRNNPQQQWNRPTHQPQKKSNVKWFVLGAIILAVLAGIVYGAAWLGRKVGKTITNFPPPKHRSYTFNDKATNAETCLELIGMINADSSLADSAKISMTNNLNKLVKNSDAAVELIRLYHDGFRDTLAGLNGIPMSDKSKSFAYFIQAGRASKLKNTLLELRNESFSNLPPSQQDSAVLNKLDVYDAADLAAHPWQTQSWETTYFNKPPFNVIITFDNLKHQISDFEGAILDQYKDYLSRPH